jgi:electron transport complex protein RnfB
MLAAVLSFTVLSLLFGLGLGWSARRFRVESDPVVDRIDAILPQTQCGQCNYPGCRPYAEAIASGEAPINQCPPGGEAGIRALADLLGVDALPLNPENGQEKARSIAVIDETACIGCTLCIQACPVDAILGAPKLMHTVIAAECTGCDLCLPPCPVDCIAMVTPEPGPVAWAWPRPGKGSDGTATDWPSGMPPGAA